MNYKSRVKMRNLSEKPFSTFFFQLVWKLITDPFTSSESEKLKRTFSLKFLVTARKRSLGQGNVLTPVCHSVHGGRGSGQPPPSVGRLGGYWADPPDADPPRCRPPRCRPPGCRPPWMQTPLELDPSGCRPPLYINKRVVRILLECILVYSLICFACSLFLFAFIPTFAWCE